FLVPLGKSADVAALFPNGTTVPSALRDQFVPVWFAEKKENEEKARNSRV
ncbi:hypothetical protein Tco_0594532, partial [Tanacetum coccineum]